VISSAQRPLPDNTHNIQTSIPPVGFETIISAGERPQTYALDRAVTRNGKQVQKYVKYYYYWYSALGPVWAETRVQTTGMALVRCILGMFLGGS
jgi:hypothetical protein